MNKNRTQICLMYLIELLNQVYQRPIGMRGVRYASTSP